MVGVLSIPVILGFANVISVEFTGVFLALFVAIFGLFQVQIMRSFIYPDLEIKFEVKPPDCHKTKLITPNLGPTIPCYYYRLKVSNIGNARAENVEIMVAHKYIEDTNGKFVADDNFLPMNLNWSHGKGAVQNSIAPKLFRYCDFGHITQLAGRSLLELDLEFKPNTGSHIVYPGRYRFKIISVADNSNVKNKIFEVTFNQFWSENEKEMLQNGLTVIEV